jgi:tyrosyl-tRNA synthetase
MTDRLKRHTPTEQLALLERGLESSLPEGALLAKLEASYRDGRPLRVKQGFDPTAPDIHLGHSVSLWKLRDFQDLGHEVVFLIGDFTAMIGDPSGRSETRPRLTRDEVEANAQTYRDQVFRILDPDLTRVEFNSRWCDPLGAQEFLRLASTYTVARLLERDDFAKRYASGQPISVLEFMYPLVQGYDSVALKADVEQGGTDQTFNLLLAREVQRAYGVEPQAVVTMPLLVGLDGTEKMSKSLGNYVGISEAPRDMFGKLMSLPDEQIVPYLELVTRLDAADVGRVKDGLEDGSLHPRQAKASLAEEVVRLYHGSEAAGEARREFDQIFREGGVPEEVEEVEVTSENGRLWVPRMLVQAGLAASNSEGRRLVQQRGVSLDGETVTSLDHELAARADRAYLVRVGRHRFLKVRLV